MYFIFFVYKKLLYYFLIYFYLRFSILNMYVYQHCFQCKNFVQHLTGVAILRAFCYATLQKKPKQRHISTDAGNTCKHF